METLKDAGKLLGSKMKGKKWADEALPVMVQVAKEIKDLEAKKKDECEPAKAIIEEIDGKYKGALNVLREIDARLRERVMNEYEETESIKQEGIGELVFAQLWSSVVNDIKKVPMEFHTIDSKAVNAEIKKGVRNIRGIEIEKRRSLQVRQDKNEKE